VSVQRFGRTSGTVGGRRWDDTHPLQCSKTLLQRAHLEIFRVAKSVDNIPGATGVDLDE